MRAPKSKDVRSSPNRVGRDQSSSPQVRALSDGVEPNFPRHGRAWPGHPRLACGAKVVDGRHKAGHDGGEIGAAISENSLAAGTRPAASTNFASSLGQLPAGLLLAPDLTSRPAPRAVP